MKNQLAFFLTLFLIFYANAQNKSEDCLTWTKEHIINNTEYHSLKSELFYLIIFDNFNELMDNAKCMIEKNIKYDVKSLKFYAKTRTLFEYVDIVMILNSFNFVNLNQNIKEQARIQILNIEGFNQNWNQINIFEKMHLNFQVFFSDLYFVFYLNNTLITKEMCVWENFLGKSMTYFGGMKSVTFLENIIYFKNICPYIFLNSNLTQLSFLKITNSLIFKNQLEFLDINQTQNHELRIKNLIYLEFNIIFEDLTLKIMNKYFFERVIVLRVKGSIRQIQEDLFEYFKYLNVLHIETDDIGQFFKNGLKWTKSLNKDLKVDFKKGFSVHDSLLVKLVKFNEIASPFSDTYSYPDKDICIFRDFPHNQLVLPMILSFKKLECTCTLIWLIRYSKLNLNKTYALFERVLENNLYPENSSVIYCFNQNIIATIDACHYEDKLKNCLDTFDGVKDLRGIYSEFFVLKWIQMIVDVYFRPLFCFVGVFTNFLIIKIIKNKKAKKDFKNLMYQNILFNSFFNFIFCFINSFSLINVCTFLSTSFCSSIYKSDVSQYFKIYVISFLGNSIRISSNVSYILFSVSRFSIISSRKFKFLEKIEKMNRKKFNFLIFILSSVLSIFKIFELKPNEIFSNFDLDFPYFVFTARYCLFTDTPTKMFSFGCKIIPILNLINNVLNNMLFIIFSIIVDIGLYRFAKQYVKEKTHMFHDQKHKDEALEHQKKINNLILINGILYFLSHFPEFITTILVISFDGQLKEFQFLYYSNNNFVEISEAFGLLAISLQFFVLNYFDNNFINSFKQMRNDFWKKYSCFKAKTNE